MLKSFVFGLTLGIAIGPISLLILNYALTRGFSAGAQSSAGSTLADFIYAVLAFGTGHVFAPYLEANRSTLVLVAGTALVLIGLSVVLGGARALKRSDQNHPPDQGDPNRGDRAAVLTRNPFVTAFSLTLVNPMTVLGFAAFGAQLNLGRSLGVVVGNAAAASAGTLLTALVISAAGGALAPMLRGSRAVGWLNITSGVAIAVFGVAGMFS